MSEKHPITKRQICSDLRLNRDERWTLLQCLEPVDPYNIEIIVDPDRITISYPGAEYDTRSKNIRDPWLA